MSGSGNSITKFFTSLAGGGQSEEQEKKSEMAIQGEAEDRDRDKADDVNDVSASADEIVDNTSPLSGAGDDDIDPMEVDGGEGGGRGETLGVGSNNVIGLMSESSDDSDFDSDDGSDVVENMEAIPTTTSTNEKSNSFPPPPTTSPSSSSSYSSSSSPPPATTTSSSSPLIPPPSTSTSSPPTSSNTPPKKRNVVEDNLRAIYDLCVFTQESFDYATHLTKDSRYKSQPFSTVLEDVLGEMKNPYAALGVRTLGHFWGTFLTKFIGIFKRLASIESNGAGEAHIFGGINDAPFCVFMIIHNLNIVGEVIFQSVGAFSKPDDPLPFKENPAPLEFTEEIFWEQVLGTFIVEGGHIVTIKKEGILREISEVVSRTLLHFRFFLDCEIQQQKRVHELNSTAAPTSTTPSPLPQHKMLVTQLDNLLATSFALHSLSKLCNNIYMDSEGALTETLTKKEAAKKAHRRQLAELAAADDDSDSELTSRSSPGPKRTTRNQEREAQDLSSINTRDATHVKYFGDLRSLPLGCSEDELNKYRTCSDNEKNLHSFDPLADEYVGRLLMKAVEEQNRLEVNRLLVYEFANPHFAGALSKAQTLSPIHTAACQNNYEILSMLLYGASVLIRISGELGGDLLPEELPARSWGRDHNKKTPFETAYDMSLKSAVEDKGLVCSPPCTEAVYLLANRGCGDLRKVDELSTSRIKLMKMIRQEEIGIGPVAYPRNDISMGAERFKIPWVNETPDGAELTPNDLHYITTFVETRHAAISWHHSIIPTYTLASLLGNKARDRQKRRVGQVLKPWDPSKNDVSCTDENRLTSLRKANKNPIVDKSLMECSFMCPCQQSVNVRHANPFTGGSLDTPVCQNVKSTGLQFPLEVFRTPDKRGWGARTQRGVTIPKGAVVCPYSGLLTDEIEVKALEDKYAQMDKGSFIMNLHEAASRLKGNAPPGEYYVNDATLYRNVAAFFNHTCEQPNVKFRFAFRNHLDVRFPIVVFVAIQDIPPMTEICFNYGEKVEGLCDACGKKHCLCAGCMSKKFASCKR